MLLQAKSYYNVHFATWQVWMFENHMLPAYVSGMIQTFIHLCRLWCINRIYIYIYGYLSVHLKLYPQQRTLANSFHIHTLHGIVLVCMILWISYQHNTVVHSNCLLLCCVHNPVIPQQKICERQRLLPKEYEHNCLHSLALACQW